MTPAEALVEAEAAWHRLMTGQAVVEFRDQNGETVRYGKATKGDLAIYIQTLKAAINGSPDCLGPMRVWL